MRHERSAGQGLGLFAPKEEQQGKFSFSPVGTTVSDCGPGPPVATPLAVWGWGRDGENLGAE